LAGIVAALNAMAAFSTMTHFLFISGYIDERYQHHTDVEEYCISEGWVKIPSPKALDRRGQPILIKLKGTVEAYYS